MSNNFYAYYSPQAVAGSGGTVTSVDASGGTTGMTFTGGPITSSGVLTLSGVLNIADGGTGKSTAAAAYNALSPMTTTGDIEYEIAPNTAARLPIGSTGNVLTVSGGAPAWAPPATSGTVTSVAATVPSVLSISGSPIISSGTLAIGYSGTALPIANGGTAQTSLGNLTDAGTDGIVVTGGTGCLITSASLAQHVADTSHNGYLSSTDWNTFNGKQAALTTGNLTDAGTDGIVVTGGTGAVIGSGTSIAQHVADTTHNGYLSSTDWNTFNGKGAGTVTSVSSSGATGLTLTTANPTTTPAITLGGTLTIGGGGTGQTVASAAFNALSPMTTAGDVIYGGASGAGTRLAAGTASQVLVGGTTPSWSSVPAAALPAITQSAAGVDASSGQRLGTNTNDAASAGNIGETLTQNTTRGGASVALTTATPKNIGASITMTAGDWDVSAMVGFTTGGTTSFTVLEAACSTTSNSLPAATTLAVPDSTGQVRVRHATGAQVNGGDDYVVSVPSYRVSVANANTVTLQLVANAIFSISTMTCYGYIQGRRRR